MASLITQGLGSAATVLSLNVNTSGANPVLTWTAKAGALSYNVLRAASPSGPYTVLASGITLTTYTDTAPLGGTSYYAIVAVI